MDTRAHEANLKLDAAIAHLNRRLDEVGEGISTIGAKAWTRINELERDNLMLCAEVAAMRRSSSWRITAPISRRAAPMLQRDPLFPHLPFFSDEGLSRWTEHQKQRRHTLEVEPITRIKAHEQLQTCL